MQIRTIGVVGGGTMGSGIVQVAAQSGFQVILREVSDGLVDRARSTIEGSLARFVKKGKLSAEERDAVLGRIQPTTTADPLAEADFAIEAVPEDEGLKRRVFTELDTVCPKRAILATNTSSISVTRIAAATQRAEKVIGMHFMNPVPLMKLVEVIRGHVTDDDTLRVTLELSERMGKVAVEAHDSPGFVSNRVLLPMINEAIYALYEGVAERDAIDAVMKLGMNHPMGPLQLADFIGLDVCLHIMNVLYDGFKDSKYRPCPLLQRMVDAGKLGKKTNAGFYDYA